NDPPRLRQLEQIVHPQVFSALSGRMRDISDEGVGVLDAIKLVESGYGALCHALWIVTCPPRVQLERLMTTRGMSEPEARARLAAQLLAWDAGDACCDHGPAARRRRAAGTPSGDPAGPAGAEDSHRRAGKW